MPVSLRKYFFNFKMENLNKNLFLILILFLAGCNTQPQNQINNPSSPIFQNSIIGNWIGKNQDSGFMDVCPPNPSSPSYCRKIKYQQIHTFKYYFNSDNSALLNYQYYRNNGGDTSESYKSSDSLVWEIRQDTIFTSTISVKFGNENWQHFPDSINQLLKLRLKFYFKDSTVIFEKYPVPDSGIVIQKDIIFSHSN